MSKPSVVIVHGACHVPEHFDDLTSVLRGAGYRVVVPPLPSTDLNPAVLSMDPDIQVVRKSIRAELDDGQDVVVFAHSYGGMPASSALPDLDRKSREELSLPGGVIGIVYCACMIPDKGSSTMDYRPGDAESLQTGKVQIVDGFFMQSPEMARAAFYNCQNDSAVVDRAISLLRPWAASCAISPMQYEAWTHIPSTYIYCENDGTMSHELQDRLTKGRGMEVIRCDADHSPFLDRPEWVARVIRKVAGETGMEL